MSCQSAGRLLCGAILRQVFILLLTVAVIAGCNGASSAAPRPEADDAHAGWTMHHDAAGFSLELPVGWRVAADKTTGRINLDGPHDEQIVVWPAWAPQGLDIPTAKIALRRTMIRLGSDLRVTNGWGDAEAVGTNAVRAIGHDQGRAAIATVAWIPTPKGAAVFFYTTAAPENSYRQEQETFSRILQGFRVTGSSSTAVEQNAAADSNIRYVSWTDPHEGAFSMQAPAGWIVEGGLIRRNALDPRLVLRIKNPEGDIILSIGDGELPGFVLLSPQYVSMFPEGSWYSPGAGIQWQVRRFTPALPFGEEYLRMKLAGTSVDFAVKDRRERPDLVQEMDREAASFQRYGQMTNSAGEIAFTCNQNGQPMQGDLLVSTQFVQSGVLHLWYAKDLLAYLATPASTAEAQTILAHVFKSIQVSPQWVARQQQTTMQVSQIATQAEEKVSNIIMSSFWNTRNAQEENARRRENVDLGTVDVIDPATGEQRKIENRSNYNWIGNNGVIVGTNVDSSPGLDFRRLTELP